MKGSRTRQKARSITRGRRLFVRISVIGSSVDKDSKIRAFVKIPGRSFAPVFVPFATTFRGERFFCLSTGYLRFSKPKNCCSYEKDRVGSRGNDVCRNRSAGRRRGPPSSYGDHSGRRSSVAYRHAVSEASAPLHRNPFRDYLNYYAPGSIIGKSVRSTKWSCPRSGCRFPNCPSTA